MYIYVCTIMQKRSTNFHCYALIYESQKSHRVEVKKTNRCIPFLKLFVSPLSIISFTSLSFLLFLLFRPRSPFRWFFHSRLPLRPVFSPSRQSPSHDNISFYKLPTFSSLHSRAILFSPPTENLHRLSTRESPRVRKFCCRNSVCQVWSLTLTYRFARYNLTIIFCLHNRKWTTNSRYNPFPLCIVTRDIIFAKLLLLIDERYIVKKIWSYIVLNHTFCEKYISNFMNFAL